jgi:hypothetical protein
MPTSNVRKMVNSGHLDCARRLRLLTDNAIGSKYVGRVGRNTLAPCRFQVNRTPNQTAPFQSDQLNCEMRKFCAKECPELNPRMPPNARDLVTTTEPLVLLRAARLGREG